jgi:hypothetical protein
MTVKELKKVLQDLPDTTEVTLVCDDRDGNTIEEYAVGAVYEEKFNQVYINC